MRALAWSLILALTTAPAIWSRAAAAEGKQWLCIADGSTGFKYKNGRWVTTGFNVEGDRYLISLKPYQGDENDMRYYAREFGDAIEIPCEINRYGPRKGIYCDVTLTELKMDLAISRYLAVYRWGFIDGDDGLGPCPR